MNDNLKEILILVSLVKNGLGKVLLCAPLLLLLLPLSARGVVAEDAILFFMISGIFAAITAVAAVFGGILLAIPSMRSDQEIGDRNIYRTEARARRVSKQAKRDAARPGA